MPTRIGTGGIRGGERLVSRADIISNARVVLIARRRNVSPIEDRGVTFRLEGRTTTRMDARWKWDGNEPRKFKFIWATYLGIKVIIRNYNELAVPNRARGEVSAVFFFFFPIIHGLNSLSSLEIIERKHFACHWHIGLFVRYQIESRSMEKEDGERAI